MSANNPRRKFLLNSAQAVALASIGGLVWSAFLKESKANPLILRPPGALEEKEFLKHCIKCGLCVEACPFDTLKLASAGDGMPIGTPYFKPRDIPCEMCPDIPCVPICPTKALDPKLVQDENGLWEIRDAKMGVAIVDKEHCIAYWGIQCDACYRACPLIGEAIKLEVKRNDRTGKHSYLLPVVESEVCTGCGKCEKACVTDKASIIVLPREIASGSVGTNYIKGWETQDENRLKKAKTRNLPEILNPSKVQDYLMVERFKMRQYQFLILRRLVQVGLLLLYFLGNYAGWKILQGNLSGSLVFGVIPLSDPFAILQLFFSGAIVGSNALIGALIVALFYGLLVGRAYCSYVCPINLITDLANYLRRILKVGNLGSFVFLKRQIRYIVLALSLILSSIFGLAAFEAISPISMLHRGLVFGMGLGGFSLLIVFLLDLFVTKNAFCGHLCPLGAFYSFIGRFALLRVKYDLESCTHCMECKHICPEKQVLGLIGKNSGNVISGECTRCGRCIEVCGDNALTFNLLSFAKRKTMNFKKVAMMSIAVLGIIFLGCQGLKSYSEDELGLRKTTLFNENATIEAYDYSGKVAGESMLIERAFENAPPMIPHSTEGMLPITKDNNACTSCHLPDIAEAVGAVSMPKSHFYNFRDNVDLQGQMDDSRFNCVICHTTQVNAPALVGNNFKADFRQDNGNVRSNLLDVLNEGLK